METAGSIFNAIFGHSGWIVALIALVLFVLFYKWTFRIFGIVIVPDDSIGTLTKKFVLFGKNRELPPGKIVALNGEAGYQVDTLAPGLHFFLWPWQYTVELIKFTVIPPGSIGVVEACDGVQLPDGRVVAAQVECDNYQDARAFLTNGGQRGVQMGIIPPGTWRINPLLFTVTEKPMTVIGDGKIGVVVARDGKPLSAGRVIGKFVDCNSFQDAKAFMEGDGERGPQMAIVPQGKYRINPVLFNVEEVAITDVPDGKIGVVTTREGKPLATGEIAGSEVPNHNLFQNPQAFVDNGGNKGLQEQVLLPGRYFINPNFATVEMVDQTKVPIANVGVVVAYVGNEGRDVTGEGFRHGNLVGKGEKGVWVDPLDPGMYPINPHTHVVKVVPTANVVLNWATGRTEAHNLDAKLSTITVRSADGFSYNLDVSQIIHIPRNDAPKVIARFGSMEALVTQVLEPTIGNYFRNAAQKSDVIDFLTNRSERQAEAKAAIAGALTEYNVGAVETLIGDINPPAELMETLTQRKVAEQQQKTFETQRLAQITRKELQQATAQADTQAGVVAAERSVEIADFNAKAVVKKASGEAEAKTINATADAQVLTVVGEATAKKTLAVGTAEAEVIQKKTTAIGQDNYRVIEGIRALADAKIPLVPQIVAGGEGSGGNSGLVNVLLANLISAQQRGVAPKAEEPTASTEAKS